MSTTLKLMMKRDAALACEIANRLGAKVLSWREIVGQGAVNYVFVVDTSEGRWVIRFGLDPLNTDDYSKEAWCLETVRAHGIFTPEFIASGVFEDVPYIVQSFVSGENGDRQRSPDLWNRLGRYARIINEIPLSDSAPDSLFPRFGRDLLSNWRQDISYNLGELNDADRLIEIGVYQRSAQSKIYATLQALESQIDRFGITHGDLVPKNTICASDGLCVLDWGSAGTGAVPYNDYLRIWKDDAQEGFSNADLNAFAEGYGLPVANILPTMVSWQLLRTLDVVRWSIDKRADLLESYAKRASSFIELWLTGA